MMSNVNNKDVVTNLSSSPPIIQADSFTKVFQQISSHYTDHSPDHGPIVPGCKSGLSLAISVVGSSPAASDITSSDTSRRKAKHMMKHSRRSIGRITTNVFKRSKLQVACSLSRFFTNWLPVCKQVLCYPATAQPLFRLFFRCRRVRPLLPSPTSSVTSFTIHTAKHFAQAQAPGTCRHSDRRKLTLVFPKLLHPRTRPPQISTDL
jgi:hypothetical protein